MLVLDKGVALWFASDFVLNKEDLGNVAKLAEVLVKCVLSRFIVQTSNKKRGVSIRSTISVLAWVVFF